nr:TRAM LAG1 CLN8 homology domain containing protein [Haemonchus contortus]
MDVWRADRWLPRGIEWHQIPTNFYDLVFPLYFALPLILFRIFFESFVGVPLGFALGYYGNSSLISTIFDHLTGGFARQTRAKRILECFWRFSYYTFAFIYGCFVLWNKSWLWDVKQCWIGYPFHPIDDSVWWYYIIETSFYYSLLFGSIFDVKRSDFWQMIIHHVVTIGLLSTSFTINFVRAGTLVLISHDVADILLEFGKLTRYDRNLKSLTNAVFVVFLTGWILTRLGYYPLVLVRSALFEAADLIQPDYELLDLAQVPYAPRLIILMLFALLVLHIFWTIIILKIVAKTITEGEAGDVRSDSELSDKEDTEKLIKQNGKKMTHKRRASKKSSEDYESDSEREPLANGLKYRRPRRE